MNTAPKTPEEKRAELIAILKKVPAELLRNELHRRQYNEQRRQRRGNTTPREDTAPSHTDTEVIQAVATAWYMETLPIINPKSHPKKLYHARIAVVALLRSHAGFTSKMIRQFYQTTEHTVWCWYRRHRTYHAENPTYAERFNQALNNLNPHQQPS